MTYQRLHEYQGENIQKEVPNFLQLCVCPQSSNNY